MSSSEVKVGAFAIGGAVVLAGIITFMGAFTFGKKGYALHINYPQVSGLMPGHVVRYAGVQVGTVKDIKVGANGVDVVVEIDDNIKIPKGSMFTIGSDGIMGEKFVNVMPSKKQDQGFIAEDSNIKGIPGGGMDEFFSQSGDLVVKLENIADAFENIFGDKEVQQSMKDGFRNMSEISKNMNTFTKVMADVAVANQQDVAVMVQQMSQLSVRMNKTSEHLESLMAGIDNNGETGKSVAAMATHLSQTTARMENIIKVLEQVAQDPVTGESLKETLVNVKQASARANKILGTVSDAQITADVSSSVKGSDWRSSLGVRLHPSEDSYLQLGAYDLGDKNKFDFIAGKKLGKAGLSMGAMQGDFGVGLDYDLSKSFRVYSQLYDFDDTKVRLGGEVRLTDNVSIYGESMDLRGTKKDTYVGMRSYF